jgi:hypothetical protein
MITFNQLRSLVWPNPDNCGAEPKKPTPEPGKQRQAIDVTDHRIPLASQAKSWQ